MGFYKGASYGAPSAGCTRQFSRALQNVRLVNLAQDTRLGPSDPASITRFHGIIDMR